LLSVAMARSLHISDFMDNVIFPHNMLWRLANWRMHMVTQQEHYMYCIYYNIAVV